MWLIINKFTIFIDFVNLTINIIFIIIVVRGEKMQELTFTQKGFIFESMPTTHGEQNAMLQSQVALNASFTNNMGQHLAEAQEQMRKQLEEA